MAIGTFREWLREGELNEAKVEKPYFGLNDTKRRIMLFR